MSDDVVSEGAQQLFNFMVHNRVASFDDTLIDIVYEPDNHTQFVNDYKIYLEELHKAKWIKLRSRKSILLGFGVIQHSLFHQDLPDEQTIQMHRLRYSERECTLIDQTFALCAQDRGGRPLTTLMQIAEYEYYNKFTVAQVLKGCQTFLAMPPEKPKAARYLRGIIRGEAERNPSMQQQAAIPVATPTPEKVAKKSSSSYELKKLRSEWVNSQIALKQAQYTLLSPQEQFDLISDLESQFDANQASV